ncbi:MAG: hypothetical protein KKH94_11215 [Candidatus Omnitrophica bacterium]|nr:hypothetical protein [Candidatus Omnitrophota bacterium]
MRVLIAILLIGALIGGLLIKYDITTKSLRYNIMMTEKKDTTQGFGIKYKKGFEIWKFGTKGLKRIFPVTAKKQETVGTDDVMDGSFKEKARTRL